MKCIDINEENYLKFSIGYNSQNQISLYIAKFYHEKDRDIAITSGLGKRVVLRTTPAKRKNMNKLIDLTSELDNNKLLEINEKVPVLKGYYGIFKPSEEF